MTKKPDRQGPSCQQLIESFSDPFVVIDRGYRIVAANKRYTERYGTDGEPVVGRYCYEVSHKVDEPCSQHGEHCPLEEMYGTGKTTQVLHIHHDPQGREERVQITATPLFDEDGEVAFMGETINRLPQTQTDDLIIGRSRVTLDLVSQLHRVAQTATTVLLTGESGVGKECAAQYIHHYSPRSAQPFVVVDCGTLTGQLIESELFGHEKGSFTGAAGRKQGLFEAAQGGTLFIDEVGELPLELQTKLLRVLESGTIRSLGGNEYRQVDVRVVAATNRDLQQMVRAGTFRQDLYYRLSAFPIIIPALSQRKDDIPLLAAHFLRGIDQGEKQIPMSAQVVSALLAYPFPGNIRELRNVLERAVILAAGEQISLDHLVFDQQIASADADLAIPPELAVPDFAEPYGDPQRLLTRRGRIPNDEELLNVLAQCNGHRAEAAQRLGVSERTLYRHLKRLRQAG